MIRITCPCCGPRDEIEFTSGGEAHIVRPASPDSVSDQDWAAYLFARVNPRGLHAERWCHTYGCGQWFNLLRDTASHVIVEVYDIAAAQPPEHET